MRIDPDECRDLLASEVRRLNAVIAAGDPALTAEEREAIEFAICSVGRDDYLNEGHAERLKETLERLKERLQ